MTLDDLLGDLAAMLGDDPHAAATLRNDLHAILMGQATIATYTPRQRAMIRLTLGSISQAELAELVGPADESN